MTEYGAQFKDESMLSIPLMMKTDPPALQMQQDTLEFGFSTDQPSGILFYVRNIESSQVEERILILLNGGDLEAHIDLGAGSSKYCVTHKHSVMPSMIAPHALVGF